MSWQVFDFVKAVAAVRQKKRMGVFAPAKCRVHHPAVWRACTIESNGQHREPYYININEEESLF
jgi:hypothetical protein